MDRQDVANILAGTFRLEDRTGIDDSSMTRTISGILAEDTADGVAKVYISDDISNPEYDDGTPYDSENNGTFIELPSSIYGEKGDEVQITLKGGKLTTPMVTASQGFGDKIYQTTELARQSAAEAARIAGVASEGAAEAESLAQAAVLAANDGARLVLTSTRGQLFKNGSESTVLQVAIFPNGGGRIDTIEGVRSRFGNGAYIEWRYMNDSDGVWHTMVNTDSHLSQGGMWCTIGPDDVDIKTTFEATLNY